MDRDHFALFGLTPAFAIDGEALDRAYRDLQAEIHPDRFAQTDKANQRLAAQWAARINEAYQTLKHPFTRACYLVGLQGVDAMTPGTAPLPMAFLEQQMQAREALAEAVANADFEAIRHLEADTRARAERMLQQLAELIDSRRDLAAAADVLRQYRFLEKFLLDIGAAYDDLES